jgi:hypothetical protein
MIFLSDSMILSQFNYIFCLFKSIINIDVAFSHLHKFRMCMWWEVSVNIVMYVYLSVGTHDCTYVHHRTVCVTKRYVSQDDMCYTTVHVKKWYVLRNGTCYTNVRVTKRYVTELYMLLNGALHINITQHNTSPPTSGLVDRAEFHQPMD